MTQAGGGSASGLNWKMADLLLIAGLFCFYSLGIHDWIWWGDEPELLTAAWSDGIAHPSGYPLYLMGMKISFWMPMGSAVWKGRMFSMLMVLAGIGLLIRAPGKYHGMSLESIGWRCGIVFLGLAPLVRQQTAIAEVYGLTFFLAAACIGLLMRLPDQLSASWLIALGFLSGLAVGHHRLCLLMLPGMGLLLAGRLHRSPNLRLGWLLAGASAFALALFLPYLLIYFRAQQDPPLNWENPSSLGNLWKVFSASQFRADQDVVRAQEWMAYSRGAGPHPLSISFDLLIRAPRIWVGNLGLGLLLVPLSLWELWRHEKRMLVAGIIGAGLPVLFIAQYHVADNADFQFLPLILIGLSASHGAAAAGKWAGERSLIMRAGYALGLCLIAAQILRLSSLPPEEIREMPARYSARMLDQTPPGSILFAVSPSPEQAVDYTHFPLLCQKEIARRGQGIALISEAFLSVPWGRSSFRREGLGEGFYNQLEKGTAMIPLIQTTMADYLSGELSAPNSSGLAIYQIRDRHYFSSPTALGALLFDNVIQPNRQRPLYFTAQFAAIEPFLPNGWAWREAFRMPMLTRGFKGLDGMPLPTGRLFQLALPASP